MTSWSALSRYALLFAGALSSTLSASASCTSAKCSPDINQVTTSTVPVIIQYAADPSGAEVTAIKAIGPVYHLNHMVHTVGVVVPPSQVATLAGRSGVSYVSLDRVVAARQTTSRPIGSSPEFTAEPINAPWAWAKHFDGQGIGVAVIDSGITPSADFNYTVKPTTPLPASPGTTVQSQIAATASSVVKGGPIVGAQATANAPTAPTAGPAAPAAPAGSTAVAQSRIVYSYNFTSSDPTDTSDAYGHGTHVAGLIAGNGTNSTGAGYSRTFKGIAPNAHLINLRVLDANGQGNDSSVIAAIQTAIMLKDTYNIRIINLSLGRPIYESFALDPLCMAVEQAWKAGIAVVVAAGNDGRDLVLNPQGYGTIEAPGNDPYVITVGAANAMNTANVTDDVMASYSSKGPSFIDQVAKPDLIAPGNLVTSVLAPGATLQQNNPTFYTPQQWYVTNGSSAPSTTYFPLSGTSMATAVASGAVADLIEAASYLTPDQMKVLLMASSNKTIIPQLNVVTDPMSSSAYIAHNDVFTQGAGYLDLAATINNVWNAAYAIPAKAQALTPVASFNSATGAVTLVPAPGSIWTTAPSSGATSIWTPTSIYGSQAFSPVAQTVAWGVTAINGASDPNGFSALWAAAASGAGSTLWSSGSSDAATVLWGRDTTSGSTTSTGNTVLWGRNSSTGCTVLWGRQTTTGSTVLWGRSDVYGASALVGESTPTSYSH